MSAQSIASDAEHDGLVTPGEPAVLRQGLRNKGKDGSVFFNLRKDPVDFRDRYYEPRPADVPPEAVPNRTLLNVRDQGEGTDKCTAHALAAVIDYANRRRAPARDSKLPEPVSVRMMFEMARHFDEMPANATEGSSLRGALKGLFHNGVCSERLAPDQPARWRLTIEAAEEARGTSLGAFFRLRHVLYDYHAALHEAGAIAVSAMLHPGWEQARSGGRNATIGPGKPPSKAEAHAFAIVGYTPDGFWIQNSYGAEWGDQGLAIWPYEDWSRNVLDAWVLWLAVPSRKAFRLVGGHVGLQGRTPFRARASVPRLEITGHYLHFEDGDFVRTGPYHNSLDTVKETARLLRDEDPRRKDGPRYDHLLLMIDSGLDSIEDMAARAAVLTPVYKAQRIYPVFVFWHSDMLARVMELLEGHVPRARERAGDVDAYVDHLLEVFMAQHARAVWQSASWEAARLAYSEDGRRFDAARADAPHIDFPKAEWRGEAWKALEILVEAARHRSEGAAPMRLHLAAHGAGVFLLGHLVARAMSGGASMDTTSIADAIGTVSLLAPACPDSFLQAAFEPLQGAFAENGDAEPTTTIYALNSDREAQDRVGPYGRSFLHLIKGAFAEGQENVVGLAPAETKLPGVVTVLAGQSSMERCNSRSHVGFAEDAATLDDITRRILSTSRDDQPRVDEVPDKSQRFAPFRDALGSL